MLGREAGGRIANSAIQQPVFAFRLDYVNADESGRSMTTSDSNYNRIAAEVSWTSQVVSSNTWLFVRFMVWVELDAPDAIEAVDTDVNTFFELGIKIPISKNSGTGKSPWFVIKYVDGVLPPNYAGASQVQAGMQFDF